MLITIISDGPRFVGDEEDIRDTVLVSGRSGDRVILQCQVDSNPKPEYRWMKNGDAFEVRRVIKQAEKC